MTDVIIIGAGMSGIAAARGLRAGGLKPLIFDKGRGIGGRMATRRVALPGGEVRFDHGAQYITARIEGFAQALVEASQDGALALWQDGGAHPHHVGLPGMSGLARSLARGIEVRQGATVTGLSKEGGNWSVRLEHETLSAPHVIVTVPAPQLGGLLGADHPVASATARVRIAPCLTLMAAFPVETPRPFVTRTDETHPLSWIAQDSSKPGRAAAGATTWVAQASPSWSERHLEEDAETLAARMLPLLCEVIGTGPADALYAAAHRWRYARVTAPLGQPFLSSACGTLHAGGDWCLGAKVEAAWHSGTAMAQAVLAARD